MEKNKSPLVSVIIPAYNSEKFIGRAINSVLNQTFQDFELIIVNDFSTDGTEEVIRKFEKKDKRIKYIKHNINSGGPAKPLNTGIKKSKGNYIAILENDDEWFPRKLEKQIKLFENSSEKIGLVSCSVLIIELQKKIIKKYKNIPHKNNFEKALSGCPVTSLSSIVFKKNTINDCNFFDENIKIAADRDFYITVLKKYFLVFVEDVLLKYNIRNDSLSNNQEFLSQKIKEKIYIINKHKKDYLKEPIIYEKTIKGIYKGLLLTGKQKKAAIYILKSIKINPFNLKNYFYLFFTFLPINTYKNLIILKRKITGNPNTKINEK
jgi:glycosyltransferase involved in cell wall biosynthesis